MDPKNSIARTSFGDFCFRFSSRWLVLFHADHHASFSALYVLCFTCLKCENVRCSVDFADQFFPLLIAFKIYRE